MMAATESHCAEKGAFVTSLLLFGFTVEVINDLSPLGSERLVTWTPAGGTDLAVLVSECKSLS